MKKILNYIAPVVACALTCVWDAQAVTINGFDFDLTQFDGASVTTTVTDANHIHGNTWDNLAGVDGYTLGELASGQFGGTDPGDHISLGDQNAVDSLTLNYGTGGFYVGTGQSALFVVYESSGRSPGQSDPGRTGWNISFNDMPAINVNVPNAGITTSLFSTYTPSHGQIVFDLTQLGFSVGTLINKVTITNHVGVGPDFTFAAHAGTSTPPVVPVPAPLAMGVIGIAMVSAAKWRRSTLAG